MRDPYESRTGGEEQVVERVDPVTFEGVEGPLGVGEVRTFREQGFLLLPGFLPAREVEELREEAARLARETDRSRDEVVAEESGEDVRSIFRVEEQSRRFGELVADPRFVRRARQILGSDVYLHQTRVNYKPAFSGAGFFWHSDFETWHVEDGMPRPRALSVALSLTEVSPVNGALMVVPGSHLFFVRCGGRTPDEHFRTSLVRQEFGVPSRHALGRLVETGGIEVAEGPPGTVLLFDSNLMHGSAPNLSPFPRTGLFLVYNSVENALERPFGGTRPRPDFLGARRVSPPGDPGTGVAPHPGR